MQERGLIGKDEFSEIAQIVLEASTADETEVLLGQEISSLTRVANNVIHQHVSEDNAGLSIRVISGKKQGRSTTTKLDKEDLRRAVAMATDIALHQKEEPELLSLPDPQHYPSLDCFDDETARFDPMDRTRIVGEAVHRISSKDLKAAGMFTTGATIHGIANSKGLRAYHPSTTARFSFTAMSETSSGWCEVMGAHVNELDTSQAADIAMDKALTGQDPVDLEPGKYRVVLEPAAMTDFLLFMAWCGFGGLAYNEGRSFMSGKLGKKVLGKNITISDDVTHPMTIGLPFDFEGMPRKRVVMIDKGVANALVHDRKTALAANEESTGHALPQPNIHGPFPLNIVMEPGDSSMEEMIAETEKGVLVTQFHYTNVIDPQKLIMTGMTRNGTFLIEKGKITRPVKNLRFTESAIRALSNVEALTKERLYCGSFFGGTFVVPGASIRDFSFSSGTTF
ncbi:TldD/PmbA family protein [Acidobacteriota bacterium]